VRLSITSLLLACRLLLLVHLKLRARTVRLAVRSRRRFFTRRLVREDAFISALPYCVSSSRYVSVWVYVCVCVSKRTLTCTYCRLRVGNYLLLLPLLLLLAKRRLLRRLIHI